MPTCPSILNIFSMDSGMISRLIIRLSHTNNTVFEFQCGRGGTSLDGFTGVFNTKQSSVGAKRRDAVIVSSSTWLHNMTSFSWFG